MQCTTACCLCIVYGHLWLMERAKRGRDEHWGNVPLHPSWLFIIVIMYINVWTREQPPVPWAVRVPCAICKKRLTSASPLAAGRGPPRHAVCAPGLTPRLGLSSWPAMYPHSQAGNDKCYTWTFSLRLTLLYRCHLSIANYDACTTVEAPISTVHITSSGAPLKLTRCYLVLL